jgi:hypothetical protein
MTTADGRSTLKNMRQSGNISPSGSAACWLSPAQGTTTGGGKTVHDEIIVFEVMTEALDAGWWRNC